MQLWRRIRTTLPLLLQLDIFRSMVGGLLVLPSFAIHAAEITALPVQGGVHLIEGAGRNVVVQRGDQGLLVVDAGLASRADDLLAAIKELAEDRTIRYVINTGADPEIIGGNGTLRESGGTILGGNVVGDDPRGQQGATVIAHANVQMRMVMSNEEPVAAELWPTETFSEDAYDLFFNDEAVQLIHPPAAHSDSDVMVFFRKSDVLVTGGVFDMTSYPVIDLERGGSINGLIAALNTIIDIVVPRDKQEGGTLVVPAQGRLCDEADVVEYRDMVTIIRDRIQDMVARDMTLAEVRAARPTLDYDGRFGGKEKDIPDQFVEAVYRSLRNPYENG